MVVLFQCLGEAEAGVNDYVAYSQVVQTVDALAEEKGQFLEQVLHWGLGCRLYHLLAAVHYYIRYV